MGFKDDSYLTYVRKKEDNGGLWSSSGSDFQNCRIFVTFLRFFYNPTKKFSSSLYVTSNNFFNEIFVIQKNIAHLTPPPQTSYWKTQPQTCKINLISIGEKGIKLIIFYMWLWFLIHKRNWNFLFYKFMEMEWGKRWLIRKGVSWLSCTIFTLLFIHQNVQVSSRSERTQREGDASDPYVKVYSWYEHFLEVKQYVGYSNVVEKYLVENCDGRNDVNFKILGWWKDNSNRYQVLSKVDKDVLDVPIFTIASELAFNTWGCIIDPFWISPSPLMVQNCICVQNWLQASELISHHQLMDEVEVLEEEFHDFGNMFKF